MVQFVQYVILHWIGLRFNIKIESGFGNWKPQQMLILGKLYDPNILNKYFMWKIKLEPGIHNLNYVDA